MLERSNRKKLVTIILDDPKAVVLSNEPVRVDGKVSGRVTSGSYGVSIGASIAFAYLPVELAVIGKQTEILVFGNWISGKIVQGPLYDPGSQKVRI